MRNEFIDMLPMPAGAVLSRRVVNQCGGIEVVLRDCGNACSELGSWPIGGLEAGSRITERATDQYQSSKPSISPLLFFALSLFSLSCLFHLCSFCSKLFSFFLLLPVSFRFLQSSAHFLSPFFFWNCAIVSRTHTLQVCVRFIKEDVFCLYVCAKRKTKSSTQFHPNLCKQRGIVANWVTSEHRVNKSDNFFCFQRWSWQIQWLALSPQSQKALDLNVKFAVLPTSVCPQYKDIQVRVKLR